jgi:tetratricopeptide (TPR) repeat protein
VTELYGRLARAEAVERAGGYAEALEMLDDVEAAARGVDYPPVHASMWLQRGRVLERMGDLGKAEDALTEAVLAAEEGGDLEAAADAWLQLIWVVGVEQQREADGRRWARFAEAAVRRLGADPLRRATLDHNLGGVHVVSGHSDLALEHYQRSLEVQQRFLGEDDPAVAMTLNHIGNVYMSKRQLERARPYCEQSLAIRRRVLGDAHPRVAPSWNNLAEIQRMQGRCDEAIEPLEQALAINAGTGRLDEVISLRIARHCYDRVGRVEEARAASDRLDLLEGRPSRDESPAEAEAR